MTAGATFPFVQALYIRAIAFLLRAENDKISNVDIILLSRILILAAMQGSLLEFVRRSCVVWAMFVENLS
jgi:hypothetical protein